MICREYHQPLSWYLALEPEERALYLADYVLRAQEAERLRRRK